MSAAIPIRLPISQIEETIEMDNPSAGKVTCVGFAPSKRRRCLNPIAASNQGLARKTIDSLPHLVNNQSELWRALLHLASLTLCRRYHQDQARSTAQNWFRTIVQESTSPEYTPLPRSISQSASSPQVERLYVAPVEVLRYSSTTYTATYTQRTHQNAQLPGQQSIRLRWQRDTIEYIAPIPQLTPPSSFLQSSHQRNLQPRGRILALPSPAESSFDPRTSSRAVNGPASQVVITQPALPTPHTTHPPAPRGRDNGAAEVTMIPPTPENEIVSPLQYPRVVEAIAEVETLSSPSSTTIPDDHNPNAAGDEDAEDEECYICYLPYSDLVQTPCGYKFCRECIGAWLANNRTCPYDRRPLQVAQLVSVVEDTCNICFENFTTPCCTPCGHIFCRGCITMWLRNGSSRSTCPMDRRLLREVDLVDLDEEEQNALATGD